MFEARSKRFMYLNLTINTDRLLDEVQRLAAISDGPEPAPAVTRIAFTEPDLRARALLQTLYQDTGLTVRVDPMGNTFARWTPAPGRGDPDLPAVGTGSHCDAIPRAGMFDGTVGILGGLEAIRALQAAGFEPKRPIELVMFTSAAPSRFGLGCIGSRALAGVLTADDLAELSQVMADDDGGGQTFDQVRRAAGFNGDLADVKLAANHYHAWVELHLEQGPKLEAKNIPIGIVMGIAAAATYRFEVTGEGGDAASVLMSDRRDALYAAAEAIHGIEQLARSSPSADLTATINQLAVFPGTVNAIPARVGFTLELRDIDQANRDQIIAAIHEECDTLAYRRGVKITCQKIHADAPDACDKRVIDATENACDQLDLRWWKMISRANHDALFMARLAPTGLILIPGRDAAANHPDNMLRPAEIAVGVEVLALTLSELAGPAQ